MSTYFVVNANTDIVVDRASSQGGAYLVCNQLNDRSANLGQGTPYEVRTPETLDELATRLGRGATRENRI